MPTRAAKSRPVLKIEASGTVAGGRYPDPDSSAAKYGAWGANGPKEDSSAGALYAIFRLMRRTMRFAAVLAP
jgi:hypothetical protein